MDVNLAPELERYVAEQVERGLYRDASEVLNDGVRLLRTLDSERAARVEALREAVGLGIAQLDRGEGIPMDEVFEQLLAKYSREEAA